jgi:TonB family protein
MIRFLSVTVAMCFGLLALPTQAKEWPSVGWFDIIEAEESCIASSEYEFDGRSDVKLLLVLGEQQDFVGLMIYSLDWSAKKDVEYPGITYTLNGFVYSDVKDDDGKMILTTKGDLFESVYKGFFRLFTVQFLDDFAKGDSLLVEKDATVITHINLHSSGAAVTKLRECAAYVKRKNDAQRAQEAQWDYIEKDPFAAENVKMAANKPPVPKNNPGFWVSTIDYPPKALTENRDGAVGFDLTISADGRVAKCEIAQSSGHPDLDAATCANVTRRARFYPATDASAKPMEGKYSNSVTWRIPKDEPAPERVK